MGGGVQSHGGWPGGVGGTGWCGGSGAFWEEVRDGVEEEREWEEEEKWPGVRRWVWENGEGVEAQGVWDVDGECCGWDGGGGLDLV